MFEESASAISSSIWASMNSWFTPTVLFLLLNLMIVTIAFTSSLANQHRYQNQHSQNDPHHPNIARSPSVLQRLKSINFYRSQDPQNLSLHHKPNPDSDTLFNVEHNYQAQQQIDTAQSHYFFQENLQTPQSQDYNVLGQAHEHKPQETQTHFVFDQKDSTLDDFQQAYEEKVEENEQNMEEICGQLTGSHFSRTKSDTEPASGEIPAKLPARMRKSASLKSAFGHFEEEEDIVEARRPATVREKGNAKVTEGDEEVDAKADDFINKFKQQLKLQRRDSIIRYKDMIGRGNGGK